MILKKMKSGRYGARDLKLGDWYNTGQAIIDAEKIDHFAKLSGDRFEIHMSKNAAQLHGFSDRVAHGLLILSVIDGLKNQANISLKAQASLNWDWKFCAPVIVGDTVSAKIEIVDISQPKSNNRAIVCLKVDASNQDGAVVQTGINKLMMYL